MPSEAEVDAKLKEIDAAIVDLQKQRRQLLDARSQMSKSTAPEPVSEQRPQTELSERAIEKSLNMLEWNQFKKKEGEWAFLRTRDGELVQDLKPIVSFIDELRRGRRLSVGRYEYVASEDKFLNRYPRALSKA